MDLKGKTLIISPHLDDEVLGCGILMQRTNVDIAFLAVGDTSVYGRDDVSRKDRIAEMEESHRNFNVDSVFFFGDFNNKLDTMPESVIVGWLDDILAENYYDNVFIPYPSVHKDHRVTYRASLAALRIKGYKKPEKFVYLYEYPIMNPVDVKIGGATYLLHDVDELGVKKNAFKAYKSQVKSKPSQLRVDSIEILSAMRGLEVGADYAEKFYLYRKILV